MNNKRVTMGIGMVLLVLAAFAAPAAADADIYFDPDPSTIEVGETATIQLMWYVDASESGARSFQVGIDFDPSVVNITASENPWYFEPYMYHWSPYTVLFRYNDAAMAPMGGFVWLTGSAANVSNCWAETPVPIANLKVVGVSSGTGPLIITHEIRAEPSIGYSMLTNCTDEIDPDKITWTNGTVGCTGILEIFKKNLAPGWNLISLPLTPVDNSTSAVLGNDTVEYDSVYKYNATAKQFECPSTMDPGIGYFVNVTNTSTCTWNYTGTAYTSMNIDLKQGLNCIGWVNTSADLPAAMSSISGNYSYVAGWAASDSKYEVYDANAPAGVPEFIDFTTMARGNGYWIAAKEDCTLNV